MSQSHHRDLRAQLPDGAGEGRWWSLTEIHELLKNRYANYDPKTSLAKLGKALNNQQFGFENDRKTSGHIYKLMER